MELIFQIAEEFRIRRKLLFTALYQSNPNEILNQHSKATKI